MADRVSASIELGGIVTSEDYIELCYLLAKDDLSPEWDGEHFKPDDRIVGESLTLHAREVAWGRFDDLEAWCLEKKIPFVRCADSCPGQWGPERVVFTGSGEPVSYDVDENGRILISQDTIRRLASMEAILAWFEEADFTVPPLVMKGE
ncbi:hypothetical protein JCM25156A_08730 [Komagataeibacter kakiaceti JCM 25156]|uniref:hypothetical protein n=1 Tax=Komagataeibacter kakiaceti TaxID=943261 RepID=UPI00046EAD8F|nr:hypothetical protein [Komagataeibacter kakiaceti]